ncbi:tyrosine-type recombinase/integrase [Halorhodospira halophila]|uniref:tyrosine-type recombinase/integrase n=1 Tax=Halorhodospira halophila TaxID=1053 RepID=UPI0019143238|nr:site-specific integrase [Halorhodospira halophila]MBK5936156.1 integrase [Halorhodospira halophila]
MSETLHDAAGRRKYLTATERSRFLTAAEAADRETRTLCLTLAYTGCRLSEALALTADRVDLAERSVVFESLKKRRRGHYRIVPVPGEVIDALDLVHDLRAVQRSNRAVITRLWPWSRETGWRRVTAVMRRAEILGPHATPKGLRHTFGVQAVASGVPLNLVQRWLGHAQLSTTAIYADAQGAEARQIAERMWA